MENGTQQNGNILHNFATLIKANAHFIWVVLTLIIVAWFMRDVTIAQNQFLGFLGTSTGILVVLFVIFKSMLFSIEKQVDNHLPTQIKDVKQEVRDVKQEVKESKKETINTLNVVVSDIRGVAEQLNNKIDMNNQRSAEVLNEIIKEINNLKKSIK